ncbi:MAG: LLM class flavin-dependent oxidoreductase [Candidatus Hodarchaeota archaeon]
MNQKLRFGIATLQHNSWENQVRIWKSIESLGFDSAWLADHFVNFMHPNAPWFEAWTLLAALAPVTSHVRIGTLVTSAPLRNPAVLARQALTVDHISNGRLELGIGAGPDGTVDPVYTMTGIEDWKPSERVARFREMIEIVDQCLRNRVSSYDGHYYQLKDTAMAPAPVQNPRPPITIGAHGKTMLKIAARYADTWNSFGTDFGAPPDVIVKVTRERIKLVDSYCKRINRDPQTLRRSLLVYGSEAETVFASEENFLEVINRYRDIGINEFIFFYPFYNPNHIPIFEKIAKKVIPKLRNGLT